MNKILIIVLAFFSGNVFAKGNIKVSSMTKVKSEVRIFTFQGFGDVRLRQDNVGEPVNSPIRLSLEVSCGKSFEYKSVFLDLKSCSLANLELDSTKTKLFLNTQEYHSDTGKCGVAKTKTIPIAKYCAK